MAFLEKKLTVKTSSLPEAGNGLFTTIFIPKGTRIIEYKGRITTWKEVSLHADNPYIFYVTRNHIIDALRTKTSLARYANDAQGLRKVKGVKNNAGYVIDDKRVFIEAIRDIPPMTEILVSYGKEYWDTVRANMKKN